MTQRIMSGMIAATLLPAVLASAAKKNPTGSFSVSPAPYVEGSRLLFTIEALSGVTGNYEVTLGVWCVRPDGSPIPWGNRNNPYIYEFNSFGTSDLGVPLVL